MRHKKSSHSYDQSWGFLFGVVVSIAALSLLVLIFMGAGLTGFAVTDPRLPTNVSVSLDLDAYPERTLVEADVTIQIDGPLDQQTSYYAILDGNRSSIRLTQALDIQGISYQLSSATPRVESATSSTTLLYPARGMQQFVFRLPKSVRIQRMQMNIHGRDDGGSYPSFPKIDANRDGQFEWEYVGDFIAFNDTFVLPAGLRENQENTVGITEQDAYYCELINLPRGRDFLVSAKYMPLLPTSEADLEAVLFSVSGSGDTVTGLGGSDTCDLDEGLASAPEYRSCQLTLSYAISGNYLLCVHNAGLNLPPDTYYELSRDIDRNSGYRCGAISNARTSCAIQQGDFFIKIQTATYDGVLNRRALISEGAPEALLPAKLNDQLQTCTAYDNYCFITLDLMSETRGSIYLDGLDIEYSDQGTPVHERNFYILSTPAPIIVNLAGRDLTQDNYTLTLPLELLDLYAPTLRSNENSKNFTLEVGMTPGPSVQLPVRVIRNNATTESNVTFTGNFTDDVAFYQQLFTSLLDNQGPILELGGYKTKIEAALQDLSRYASLSRGSSNDSNASLAQLEDQLQDDIKVLPQYIASLGSSSFTPPASISDFKDDYIYPQQRSEKSKQQLAYLQQQYAPTVTIEAVEVVLFNKQRQSFTIVEHGTTTSLGAGKMLVFFPSGFATSATSISFARDPDATLSTSPLVVSWDASSLPTTMRYVVKNNLLSAAEDLRILFVPERIPETTEQPVTTCGDGKCSVFETPDGQKIYLEDSASCPADCGGQGTSSWTIAGALLLLVVLLMYYFGGIYKGPGNFHELLQRFKKSGASKGASTKLFASASDEANLRTYVQNAFKKGVTKEAVTETLLNRGWTKQQVDAVVKQTKP